MSLALLRRIDRWIGIFLLYILVLPVRVISWIPSALSLKRPRHVFLKLKGGGSLIVALPSLLGLRQKSQEAEFVLICTADAKIYAELTGIFDRYLIIDDASLITLALSACRALWVCFRAKLCVDLEPNSLLAAVFTMLTCARQRIGLVKSEQPVRAVAYTTPIPFDVLAPIYIFYDRICETLGAQPASDKESQETLRATLPPSSLIKSPLKTIGITSFTSDFARERMMPQQTWIDLLLQSFAKEPIKLLVFGAERHKDTAEQMRIAFQKALPNADVINLCGTGNLANAASQLTVCDEVWAVDSGLLHITRLLGIPTRSFWGPTMPSQRLRSFSHLREEVFYRPFKCSPCIQSAEPPPCGGNNLCMISMAEPSPNLQPVWASKK